VFRDVDPAVDALLWPNVTNKEVNYVLRAWTFIDTDGNETPDLGELIDATPANTQFTLVWRQIKDFLRPPDDKDAQPLKIVEPL
jgi:hypothetical protein